MILGDWIFIYVRYSSSAAGAGIPDDGVSMEITDPELYDPAA